MSTAALLVLFWFVLPGLLLADQVVIRKFQLALAHIDGFSVTYTD